MRDQIPKELFAEFSKHFSEYEAPPQRTWVGLTDEEIKQSHRLKCMEFGHWLDERTFLIACNWAETKLKDKNNA